MRRESIKDDKHTAYDIIGAVLVKSAQKMLEINPIKQKIADLKARSQSLRGYL